MIPSAYPEETLETEPRFHLQGRTVVQKSLDFFAVEILGWSLTHADLDQLGLDNVKGLMCGWDNPQATGDNQSVNDINIVEASLSAVKCPVLYISINSLLVSSGVPWSAIGISMCEIGWSHNSLPLLVLYSYICTILHIYLYTVLCIYTHTVLHIYIYSPTYTHIYHPT